MGPRRSRPVVAVILAAVALSIWGWHLRQRYGIEERSLRDTAGMEASVIGVSLVERGYRIQCRIVNRSPQPADQVVFEVAVLGADGAVIGSNPLAGASGVKTGETRDLAVLVPASMLSRAGRDRVPHPQAVARITLVRWGK